MNKMPGKIYATARQITAYANTYYAVYTNVWYARVLLGTTCQHYAYGTDRKIGPEFFVR